MKILKIILILLSVSLLVFFAYQFKWEAAKKDDNVLLVGTSLDYPPYEFVDMQTGQPAGLDIDLLTAIAQRLNKNLIIKNMPFTSLIFALLVGDIDMIAAGMTPTPRRSRMVAFTNLYLQGQPLVIFTKTNHFKPKSVQDLFGKKVAVNLGYFADVAMSAHPEIELVKFDSPSDCFMALQVGVVDAFVSAQVNVDNFLKYHNRPGEFFMVKIPGTREICALAVNKNNIKLLEEMNQVLDTMKIDKTLDQLKEKWGF